MIVVWDSQVDAICIVCMRNGLKGHIIDRTVTNERKA